MNEALNCLFNRRSIRKYKEEQVSAEELKQILAAGMYAPTAMGQQSPLMVVVQDADTIGKLSKLNAQVMGTNGDPFYGAPTVVVVFADRENGNGVQDASLVMGNLMNGAAAVGVGSCWINRAREVFEMPEGIEIMTAWGMDPSRYVGVGNCILGYADGEVPAAKPRKEGYVKFV